MARYRAVLLASLALGGCDAVFGARFPHDAGSASDDGAIDGEDGVDAPGSGACGRAEERLCLTFDDLTEGDTSTDGSGYDNHARVTGAMRTSRNGRGAITVDATSELAITQEQGLDIIGPLSFALWMDYRIAQNAVLFDNHTQYAITQVSDSICCNVTLSESPGSATACRAAGTGWRHITCVKTAALLSIYVDGTFGGAVTANAPVSTGITDVVYVRIGQDAQPSPAMGGEATNPFDGHLDDVHVFARALELVEIVELSAASP